MNNLTEIYVIVPVYKVEEYLPQCIDSILAKTFTDFELLLVDDGSPDRCGAICEEYAGKDTRIRVFPVSYTHLSALKHTINGDFNLVSTEEVEALAGGDAIGRVQR